MPGWVARLPTKIGYPAGGSLTADEWKCLGMVFGPAVVSTLPLSPFGCADGFAARSRLSGKNFLVRHSMILIVGQQKAIFKIKHKNLRHVASTSLNVLQNGRKTALKRPEDATSERQHGRRKETGAKTSTPSLS